jgi:uncharacterized protein with FMN-binding domain
MVENGRDCSEVLIQLSAVIAALNKAGKLILEDHIETCIVDAVQSNDQKPIEDLKKAIMDAQSAQIDAISGATTTSAAVKKATEACIAQAKGEAVVLGGTEEGDYEVPA